MNSTLLTNVLLGISENETYFLVPFVILLGISIVFTILTTILKLNFIPSFIFEIIIGICLRQILYNHDINANFSSVTNIMYITGFILIMFMSGYDNNFHVARVDKIHTSIDHINIKGLSHVMLIIVYLISLVLSFIFFREYEIKWVGVLLVMVTISATFAGVVVPLIKAKRLEDTIIGNFIIYFSTVSELVSVLFLTILMIVMDISWVRLFAYLGIIVIFIIMYFVDKIVDSGKTKRLREGITYLPTRLALVSIAGCVILSEVAGGEYVLGAFLLGIFLKYLKFDEKSFHHIESLSYSLFVPIFFIIVGTKIDIRVFINEPIWLVTVLLLTLSFFVSKFPLLYLCKWYKLKTTTIAVAINSCTLIVGLTTSHIGIHYGVFSSNFGESIILASIITCIITTILFETSFPHALKSIAKDEQKHNFYGSLELQQNIEVKN